MGEPEKITQNTEDTTRAERAPATVLLPALVVAFWRSEPGRVGEVLLPDPDGPRVWGRAAVGGLSLVRQRPGRTEPTANIRSDRISRHQLSLSMRPSGGLQVTSLGRRALLLRGEPVARAGVQPGDVLEIERELVLLCTLRPAVLAPAPGVPLHPWGQPDADGLVGESPAVWELRRALAFVAPRRDHALLFGPSGSGKELAAAALHRRSPRRDGPFISRNAATIPDSLVDAELFGNARNYPNPGMAERSGLVGAAHGGTLFLDELGELPQAAQAHLLRVLDGGEHQRLGENRTRRSDFRLIGATNRPPEALKHDVLARLPLRVVLPGLDARREDIPLLAAHLLQAIAQEDPALGARFLRDGRPALTPALVAQLLTWPYRTHVRELRALLLRSMAASAGDALDALPDAPPPGEDVGEPAEAAPVDAAAWAGTSAVDLPPAVVQAALDQCNGRQEDAWRLLGLDSRYQLRRLIQRHGLVVRRTGGR